MRVGFIGLGAMGPAMATRLIDAGHEVHVWNRSPEPCEELEQRGGHRLQSLEGAFIGDAVGTCLRMTMQCAL
jgi:3-hydroxyisobutyrate dehydrogenase-like beta-hydroxyacid dehydrogenase